MAKGIYTSLMTVNPVNLICVLILSVLGYCTITEKMKGEFERAQVFTAHYLAEARSLSISSPDYTGHYIASPINTKSIKAHWRWPVLP